MQLIVLGEEKRCSTWIEYEEVRTKVQQVNH